MNGLISFGNKRSYDEFKQQLTPIVIPLFDKIRDHCFSLGSNVIEDVRMHRIVMCKSISFRWFLDIEPHQDLIMLKLQMDRKTPYKIFQIKSLEDFEEIKGTIKEAYYKIH